METRSVDIEEYEKFLKHLIGHDPYRRAHDIDRSIHYYTGRHDKIVSSIQDAIRQNDTSADLEALETKLESYTTILLMIEREQIVANENIRLHLELVQ